MFEVEIVRGGDGMRTTEDVSHELRQIARKIDNGHTEGLIIDLKGNVVGNWELSEI